MNIILKFFLISFYILFVVPYSFLSRIFNKKLLDLKWISSNHTYWKKKEKNMEKEKSERNIHSKNIFYLYRSRTIYIFINFLFFMKYFLYPKDLSRINIVEKESNDKNEKETIVPDEIYPLW